MRLPAGSGVGQNTEELIDLALQARGCPYDLAAHQKALQAKMQDVGERFGIGMGVELAQLLGALQAPGKGVAHAQRSGLQAFGHRGIAAEGFERGVDQQAGEWRVIRADVVVGAVEECPQAGQRGVARLKVIPDAPPHHLLDIMIERRKEQPLFRPEPVVDGGCLEPQALFQLADAGVGKPVLPEQAHGSVEKVIVIEAAGAGHGEYRFIAFDTKYPPGRNPSTRLGLEKGLVDPKSVTLVKHWSDQKVRVLKVSINQLLANVPLLPETNLFRGRSVVNAMSSTTLGL